MWKMPEASASVSQLAPETEAGGALAARLTEVPTNKVLLLEAGGQRQMLERAREFGADELINPGSNDPVAAIKDLTHGKYADLTLDTSSNREARLNANEAKANEVVADFRGGEAIGVNSTPSLFINGTLYKGARSVDELDATFAKLAK